MNMALSERVSQIKPSATIAVNSKAAELRAEGHDIINLSVGEPDFDTPEFVKNAAIEAIQQNFTRYTAVDGIPELKQAIIGKLQRDNQLDYEPAEIIVSTGVKQALYNLTQVILNPGDEVIIPAPYWVSYPAMTQLAGATPVIVNCPFNNRFKLTPELLEQAITPKTRLLMINSPSNPSGMAYSLSELTALAEVLKKHPQVLIASDDIYEYILWNGQFASILNACPELKDRTIIFNGVSKAHAMTGWRIGYAAGPKHIITAMKKIQSQSTSNPNSIAQKAAVAALNGGRDFFAPMLAAFKERHDFVYDYLTQQSDIDCLASDGTFYVYPNVSKLIEKLGLSDDVALAEYFLEKSHVALVPGTAFGTPGFIRISCATSLENLKTAMQRLFA